MANSESKVSPGDPFVPPPAAIWNNMVDAGDAWSKGRLNSGDQGSIRPRSTDMLKLLNSSGANRARGEILKISGKVIETISDEHKWLNGIAPTESCRFGILKDPALSSEVVTAQVSGCCIALVDITDTDHTHADAADGEYVLASGESGPIEILYAPDATGEQECVVRFAGGSGGEGLMMFRPFEVCQGIGFTCDCVNAEVITPACNSSLSVGDEVQVWDVAQDAFLMPPALLFNSIGFATYMKIHEGYDRPEGLVGDCRWVVVRMSCVEQELYPR